MAIRIHEPKFKTVRSIEYQVPGKKLGGGMTVCRTEFCDDLDWMKAHVARRGGSILQIGEPRQIEYMDVSF